MPSGVSAEPSAESSAEPSLAGRAAARMYAGVRACVRMRVPAEHGDCMGRCIKVVREELEFRDTSFRIHHLNPVQERIAAGPLPLPWITDCILE